MKNLIHILSALILFTIPVISAFSAFNIVTRAPDLYVYEFTKAKASQVLNIDTDDQALGVFFSDFMKGKQETFEFYTDVDEREPKMIFTAEEAEAMELIRFFLNESLYILIAAALITGIAYWFLVHYNSAEEIRDRFLWSLIPLLGFWAIFLVLLLIEPNLIRTDSGDILHKLVTPSFVRDWFLACFSISAVVLGILASVSWRISKPKMLFR